MALYDPDRAIHSWLRVTKATPVVAFTFREAKRIQQIVGVPFHDDAVGCSIADKLKAAISAEPHRDELNQPDRFAIDAGHLERQRNWSLLTFGPSPRTQGVVDHIREELEEILADPTDIGEWADVMNLAMDGAWRAGHEPQAILDAVAAKQEKNEGREWPDWRDFPPDVSINHVRDPQ